MKNILSFLIALMSFNILLFQLVYPADINRIHGEIRIPPAGIGQIIIMKNGSKLVGDIAEIHDNEIVFNTEFGRISMSLDKIQKISEFKTDNIEIGKFWFPDPNQTRLFFSPTGRMLKQGQGYLSDIYLFFTSFAVGLSDNFTIGAGMSIFPGVDIQDQFLFITPRIGISAGSSFSFAVSGLIIRIPDIDNNINDESKLAGIVFPTMTTGSSDMSFTASLGYGFVDDNLAEKPAVMLGGQIRISNRSSFVSENWVFPGIDNPLFSYGIRLFGDEMAIDLAFFNNFENENSILGIPYMDFVWNF